ncbi:MAG TPA: hypothetical protein VF590_10780, partial [Isosphaeraceae bacterium]
SPGGDLRYQWVQSRGALVRFLDGATAPSARIQLPDSSGPLEFLLVVSHPGGVASAALTLYVPAPGEDDPVADAGDALRGTVGQPVQLDGARSEPRGHLVYKWIALAGPDAQPVALDASGAVATFTPRVPGLYRFLLVVASARAISDPDAVDVLVVPPPPPPPPTIEQVAATALEAVDGGAAAAGALGEVFDALAGRIDLYRSYEDVYQEMSRRLEAIVPDDPARRAAWAERVFVPLTARLIEGLRAEGLDLTRGEGPSAAMTEDQKARLADLLRGISGGFRAAGATP